MTSTRTFALLSQVIIYYEISVDMCQQFLSFQQPVCVCAYSVCVIVHMCVTCNLK